MRFVKFFLVFILLGSVSFAEPFEILGLKSGMTVEEVKSYWPINTLNRILMEKLDEQNAIYDQVHLYFTEDGLLYSAEAFIEKSNLIKNSAAIKILEDKYKNVVFKNYSSTSKYGTYEAFLFQLIDDDVLNEAVEKLKVKLLKTMKF